MDSSSSGLPALGKRSDDGGAAGSPADKRPCVEPVPEDLLHGSDDDLGEEPLPCFAFEEALVIEVMKELEETIRGAPKPLAMATRTEDLSGPLISKAGSSIMASVDVSHAPELFYAPSGNGLPSIFPDDGNSGASFLQSAAICHSVSSGEKGDGAAAANQLGEMKEKEEEEWLTRVLSGPPLEFKGF